MGKSLIIMGLMFIGAGLIVGILPGGLPRLPGDIHIRGDNFTFYFPLGWSVLLGVLISLAWSLLGK